MPSTEMQNPVDDTSYGISGHNYKKTEINIVLLN